MEPGLLEKFKASFLHEDDGKDSKNAQMFTVKTDVILKSKRKMISLTFCSLQNCVNDLISNLK